MVLFRDVISQRPSNISQAHVIPAQSDHVWLTVSKIYVEADTIPAAFKQISDMLLDAFNSNSTTHTTKTVCDWMH